jgi:hypothetical protein
VVGAPAGWVDPAPCYTLHLQRDIKNHKQRQLLACMQSALLSEV